MGVLTEKPEDIGLDSKSPAERDRIDLGHEIAGRQTGRMKRFLSDDGVDVYGETDKKKSEREFRTLIQILLAEDPRYAALYTRVADKLDKARQATDQALIDINQRLEASERQLQRLRDQAAEFEDGTKVFRSENDDSVYTEEGKRLGDDLAQNVAFSGNEPSWEEYRAAKEAHGTAARQKEEVEAYQRDVLDPAEVRMKDADDPPSVDELERIEQDVEAKMPEIVKAKFRNISPTETAPRPSPTSAAHNTVKETELNVPDMGKAFDVARVDIPDLGPMPGDDPAPPRAPGQTGS